MNKTKESEAYKIYKILNRIAEKYCPSMELPKPKTKDDKIVWEKGTYNESEWEKFEKKNKTKESWEEDTLKQEFIRNFCNDHQRIRWLRGVFWDEEEKLNTILEYFDKYEKLLQSQESRYKKVFKWLLGYNSFPSRKKNEGAYYWRSHLRKKLSKIGIKMK